MIGRSMVTIGGVLILITGLYLAADRWEFSDFFVAWGILAILVLLGLVHGFFLRNDQRALAVAKRDIEAAGPTGEVEFSEESRESGPQRAHGPDRRPDRDPDDLRDGRQAVPVAR